MKIDELEDMIRHSTRNRSDEFVFWSATASVLFGLLAIGGIITGQHIFLSAVLVAISALSAGSCAGIALNVILKAIKEK